MGKETKIEWCDSTINPISGCDGCELSIPGKEDEATCYAHSLHKRRLAPAMPEKYAENFHEVRMIPGRMAQAAAWPDLTGKDRSDKPWMNGRPRHIFIGDLADVFSKDVSDEFIVEEIFGTIAKAPQHTWIVLTKRPKRMRAVSEKMGGFPLNTIAMTSVTDQRTADSRISELLRVKCRTRGISMEPLLGPVDLGSLRCGDAFDGEGAEFYDSLGGSSYWRDGEHGVNGPSLDWVILGGESGGSRSRPLHYADARKAAFDCMKAKVPFFFKQWGDWLPGIRYSDDKWEWQDGLNKPGRFAEISAEGKTAIHRFRDGEDTGLDCYSIRIGKGATGASLDGREYREMPAVASGGRQ